MMAEQPCLHCEISDLIDKNIAHGLTINEVVFKQVEALAEVIAGFGDPRERRHFIRDVEKRLREMTAAQVKRREAEGVPSYPVLKIQ